jgi:hypothetical protein
MDASPEHALLAQPKADLLRPCRVRYIGLQEDDGLARIADWAPMTAPLVLAPSGS